MTQEELESEEKRTRGTPPLRGDLTKGHPEETASKIGGKLRRCGVTNPRGEKAQDEGEKPGGVMLSV